MASRTVTAEARLVEMLDGANWRLQRAASNITKCVGIAAANVAELETLATAFEPRKRPELEVIRGGLDDAS
jgi:hypothetical protein